MTWIAIVGVTLIGVLVLAACRPNHERTGYYRDDRLPIWAILWAIFSVACFIAFWGAVIFVAHHFIVKYW